MVKQYIQNTLKVEDYDSDFNCIHWFRQRYQGDGGKECQLMIIKFKEFHPENERI